MADMREHPVIGVLSACGGAGGSVFAAVLAALAEPSAFLIDCDVTGGGVDVLLGCEQVPGPRWGQVRLRGGDLDPAVLRDGLPRWGSVWFLAADSATPIEATSVESVVMAAAAHSVAVLDLPRWPSPVREAGLSLCDLVVLVTPAEVRAVTAAALISASLPAERLALVVRGSSRAVPVARVAALLSLPVLGSLPYDPASQHPSGLDPARLRRATRRVAGLVLARALNVGVAA